MYFGKYWLFYIVLTVTSFTLLTGNPYTAVIHLQALVSQESEFVKALRKYIFAEQMEDRDVPETLKSDEEHVAQFKCIFNNSEQTRKGVTGILAYIEPISDAAMQNPHYAENPINSFHLIKRYTKTWNEVFDQVLCDDCEESEPAQEFRRTVTNLKKRIKVWPTDVDVKGLSRALFRLWIVYDLDLVDLFNGKIYGEQAEPFSTSDVLLIARYADDDNMFYYEIKWLEKYSQIMHYMEEDEAMKLKVTKSLAAFYNRYGMPTKALEILKPHLEGNPAIQTDYDFYERHKNDIEDEEKEVKLINDDLFGATEKYHALCRGNIKTPKESATLKCFNRKTKIPYYRSKEEVANYNPRISLFHDVISENEARQLRNAASIQLDQSTVVGMQGDAKDKYRVSNTAWLSDKEHMVLKRLSKRVSIITGLNTEFKDKLTDAEKFQVLNYGAGGMYKPHHDYIGFPLWGPPDYSASEELVGTGDRTATWLYYLSDVKAGGATVFPQIKVRIPVLKGAAAFWYNYKPSGEEDPRTLHAGCPVLLGSKWVANKWIRQSGQVFTRLCGKTIESKDNVPEI